MGQIYGRWIDLEGNLHYFDTEKGEVIEEKEKESEVRYKVFIDPMPSNCYVCPIFNNACGEVECWCNLDHSIGEFRDNQANSMTDEEGHMKKVRPDNCPLRERAKGKWIYHIDDLFPAESTQECDQCHEHQYLTCDNNFCPNCGAKMEVDE